MLAFFWPWSGNVTTTRLKTLPPPDIMSVTLIQPRKREARWTNLDPVNDEGYRVSGLSKSGDFAKIRQCRLEARYRRDSRPTFCYVAMRGFIRVLGSRKFK
jgi:hypothetical protein